MRKSRMKSANMYDEQSKQLFKGYRMAKLNGDTQRAQRYYDAYSAAFNRGLDIYENAVKGKQKELEKEYEKKIQNGELTRHQASKIVYNETQKHMNRLYSTSKNAVDARKNRAKGLVGG